jgi:hypothetical protein
VKDGVLDCNGMRPVGAQHTISLGVRLDGRLWTIVAIQATFFPQQKHNNTHKCHEVHPVLNFLMVFRDSQPMRLEISWWGILRVFTWEK